MIRSCFAICLLIVSIIITVYSSNSNNCIDNQQQQLVSCRTDDASLRFFLIGDFGGLSFYPYITYAQTSVAKTLAKLGTELNTQFQLALGDNIYFTGVSDVHDSRFQSTFEDVYSGDALKKPWYVIGGNHDHYGNIDAQVAYTNLSARWIYPSLYYKLTYQFAPTNKLVDFLMIDTIVLCGNTKDISNTGFWTALFADSQPPNNPKDVAAAELQWAWIEQQLNQSTADYLFVVGHYPVYSIAEHGPTQCLVDRLPALLIKYRVTAYISGHDHTIQHIVTDEFDTSATMNYIVSGAASRSDRSRKHEKSIPDGSLKFSYPSPGWNPFAQIGFTTGAFVYVELRESTGKFDFYTGAGKLKYTAKVRART